MTAARALIHRHRPDQATELRLDQVEAALDRAEHDRASIRAALAQLDPERVGSELKTALRASPRNDALVATLRRRHETVHGLQNLLDDLATRTETTVADLETLAARTTQTMVAAGAANDLDGDLDQLHLDITALAAAHDELAELDSRPERNIP